MPEPGDLCTCGHPWSEHTSNYPNPGMGCDHRELPKPRGSPWDRIPVGCACMEFVPAGVPPKTP